MTVSAGKASLVEWRGENAKSGIYDSIQRLSGWLERNDYRGYDTFDGLNAKLLRPLTFNNRFLRTALQQGVRRFPINLRPWIGSRASSRSTKGMGFLARGFMRMHEATGDEVWRDKAEYALGWLIENQSRGYTGACWGNHFDYQSRSFYRAQGVPTVVWTSLIGHAFLDAYEHFRKRQVSEVATSSCEHILHDLSSLRRRATRCASVISRDKNAQVHNANTLGASLLARTYMRTRTETYRALGAESDSIYGQPSEPRRIVVLRGGRQSALGR